MNRRVEEVRKGLMPIMEKCPFCGSAFEMKIKRNSESFKDTRIAFFKCPACGTKSKDFIINHDSVLYPDVMDNFLGNRMKHDA